MSRNLLFGLTILLSIGVSFFIGLYVGGAPLRQYVELTGGAPGIAATELKNLANQLVDQNGDARDAAAIAERSKQTLRVHLMLAAQLYCRMPGQYQQIARESAERLQASMVGTDDRTARAILFLSKGSGSGDGCFSA
ncbi:hypothetical protein [Frateuria defendens]|uniref:hypothetical protein n=1 Tax=Frateuria defendens TaxID=2219559 RepID=UPI00129416F0|nr:hypothetical protein [Frateuria defendens]